MRCVAILLAVIVSSSVATAQPEAAWKKLSDSDGILVEGRPMPGTQLREVKAFARSTVPAEQIFDVIWHVADQHEYVPNIKFLHVLRSSDEEVVIHERVKIPVAQDRDYVLRLTKKIDREHGVFQVFAEGKSELGPPPDKGVVRMTRLWSTYTIRQTEKGSEVTYVSFGDPTGSLPAWIIRAADQRGPHDFVKAILKRAEQKRR